MLYLMILFFSFNLEASKMNCKEMEKAAEMADFKKLREKYQHQAKNNLGDVPVQFDTVEQARKYVYNNPLWKELKLGDINPANWTKIKSDFATSSLYGKAVGWEKKLDNGTMARIRLDVDNIKKADGTYEMGKTGAHYNIEIYFKNERGQKERVKMAVKFNCNNGPCSTEEVINLASKI